MKKCVRCGIEKQLDEFPKSKGHKFGVGSYCLICNNTRMKEAYKNKPEIKRKQVDRVSNRKQKLSDAINSIKKVKQCCICGENEPICLDFHHLDSSKKDFTISQLRVLHSRDKIIEEIKKCTVVCSNCHRKIHGNKISVVKSTSYNEDDFYELKEI